MYSNAIILKFFIYAIVLGCIVKIKSKKNLESFFMSIQSLLTGKTINFDQLHSFCLAYEV